VPSLLLRDKRAFAGKGALSQRRGRRPLVAQQLILKRASASRPSGEWSEDDYDVLADGAVVGRIMKSAASPVGPTWMWTLAFGHHEDRTPTHGYEPTREAAMSVIF
jgi:hypothetical protein